MTIELSIRPSFLAPQIREKLHFLLQVPLTDTLPTFDESDYETAIIPFRICYSLLLDDALHRHITLSIFASAELNPACDPTARKRRIFRLHFSPYNNIRWVYDIVRSQKHNCISQRPIVNWIYFTLFHPGVVVTLPESECLAATSCMLHILFQWNYVRLYGGLFNFVFQRATPQGLNIMQRGV